MSRVRIHKLHKRLLLAKQAKQSIMQKAYNYFKSITPIRTGAARRNTKLEKNVILADYQYAEVLDKGRHMTSSGARGSKQAPRGMSNPTIKRFGEWLRNFIKGV
jgi:hypothetical protein